MNAIDICCKKNIKTTPKLCQSLSLNPSLAGRIYEFIQFWFNFSRVIASVTHELISWVRWEQQTRTIRQQPLPLEMEILAAGETYAQTITRTHFSMLFFQYQCEYNIEWRWSYFARISNIRRIPHVWIRRLIYKEGTNYELWQRGLDSAPPINLHTCKYNMYLCCAV